MTRTIVCIDCGTITEVGHHHQSRCVPCKKARQSRRNADPKRKAYADPAYLAVVRTVCLCCGSRDDLTRHHVDPLHGGSGGRGPIVTMCRPCNASIRDGDRCRMPDHTWVRGE